MNTLNIASAIVSMICMIIMAVLAWVVIYRKSRTEVSFTGIPTEKLEFDRHCQENKAAHDQLFAKIGGVERGVEARMTARIEKAEAESLSSRRLMHADMSKLSADVAGIKAGLEGNTALTVRLDTKMDRILEREHAR
jgi:hypothetical protein